MLVLTVNPGSSSLRAHLVDTSDDRIVESAEIGQPAESEEARDELSKFIDSLPTAGITAVAVRVVHGGPDLVEPVVADAERLDQLRAAASLAPLHLPGALAVLDLLHQRIPERPLVVCPDTAFHSSLPEVARAYAVPARWREEWQVRRYGFHGYSFSWAASRAASLLGKPLSSLDLLIAHLSGGCSVCAVHHGVSVDTSMGMTPLEGAAMSKRSGTVDPGMLLWLLREKKVSVDELERGLQEESGLLGLSGGVSGDTRDLVGSTSPSASFALRVFAHRARREMAGVAASLDRVDAVVFTGDIGWDQPEVVEEIAGGLGVLGISGGLSVSREEDGVISSPDARVPVIVVRSREELTLARAAAQAAQPG